MNEMLKSKIDLKGKNVLVTGAAGFIGYHLCEALLKKGANVVGLDSLNDYYEPALKYSRLAQSGIIIDKEAGEGVFVQSNKYAAYRFLFMNLNNKMELEKLFRVEHFHFIVNLAGQAGVRYSFENPYSYVQTNVLGFLNLLECCRKWPVEHLFYASSSSVYGRSSDIPYSESQATDRPVSLYAATKKSDELMSYVYSSAYGICTTGLRFFTVYGPWGRPDMSPCLFLKAMLENRAIHVFNNGDMSRDFTYIDDIINGIVLLMEHPVASDNVPNYIYNIGNSQPVKLMDFISTLESVANVTAKKIMEPMQRGDVYTTFADISEIQNAVGYKPQIKLRDGLHHFCDWYVKWHDGEY